MADLAAQGLTTRQMAETLFVTTKTVEYHLRHIYQKLGVNSRDSSPTRWSPTTECQSVLSIQRRCAKKAPNALRLSLGPLGQLKFGRHPIV